MNSTNNEKAEVLYTPDPLLRNPISLLGKIFSENWARRGVCAQLFLRNLKSQYRQTFLGFAWLFLPAIANALIWLFLRSFQVVNFSEQFGPGYYLLYVLVGTLLWQCFVEAYSYPLATFERNRATLSKINFPRESILLVALFEVVFNLLVRSLMVIPFLIYYRSDVLFSPYMALFPVVALGVIFVGLTIGLFIVPFGALYQDVGKFLVMIGPIWMILTPIIYPVPTSYPANLLVYCNAASPLIITAREILLGNAISYPLLGVCLTLICVPIFFLGLIVFRVAVPILIERSGS